MSGSRTPRPVRRARAPWYPPMTVRPSPEVVRNQCSVTAIRVSHSVTFVVAMHRDRLLDPDLTRIPFRTYGPFQSFEGIEPGLTPGLPQEGLAPVRSRSGCSPAGANVGDTSWVAQPGDFLIQPPQGKTHRDAFQQP